MSNTYSAVVTGSFQPNTDQIAIEIDAAANTTLKIKKIRITQDDGTNAATADTYRAINLITESVGTAGGSTYTPIPIDANAPASTASVKIGPAAKGTVATTIDSLSIHSGTDFFWQAADEDDKITILPGGIFSIVINVAG